MGSVLKIKDADGTVHEIRSLQGKTAYQYAQEGGYTGTEAEFKAKMTQENIPAPATASVGQTIVVKAVDETGKPTEWEAMADRAWEPVAEYVHSGNPVIQPTELDLDTGCFTCVGHGLTEGDILIPVLRESVFGNAYKYLPTEFFSRIHATDAVMDLVKVQVVDENTFTVSRYDSDTPLTYNTDSNAKVDVTKFFFEKAGDVFGGFSNLSIDLTEYDIKLEAWNFFQRVTLMPNGKTMSTPTWVDGYGHAGGVSAIPLTPVVGAACGEAVISLNPNAGIAHQLTIRQLVTVPMRNIAANSYATSGSVSLQYHTYLYAPDTNGIFADNPVITKFVSHTYTVTASIGRPQNGGWVKIWKRKK